MNLKMIAGFGLLVFCAIHSSGQAAAKTTETAEKNKAKLDKNKVPKEVTEAFAKENPITFSASWYSYPAFDNSDEWYDYGYTYSPNPQAYIVEFTKNNIAYKNVYAKNGKKVATHKTFTSELPKAVSAAIGKSAYKTWTTGKEKEEIFKDKDSDQLKVYKVDLTKGNEKHTLFFRADGKLLKDKKVS